MGRCGVANRADGADFRVLIDPLIDGDAHSLQMEVFAYYAVAMADCDVVRRRAGGAAGTVGANGCNDLPGARRIDRRSGLVRMVKKVNRPLTMVRAAVGAETVRLDAADVVRLSV
jgi:hypothetical protein